jgi:branched-chain amino acid transport system ATP-binding protein
MVEHVMKAIMDTCDRIIVLHHGEKIAEGKPEEVAKNKSVVEVYLGE